ncbi:MAG: GDP-mannose 4,6-dehydratase [Deltaproteobacteria bacterium]|nr:GDP-mannose 4,6-dehydratase [Deltaproteobacteria bacterium]
MSKKILITGGAGFIGSNFVHYIVNKYPDYTVYVVDSLTYAGNLDNIPREFFDLPNFHFVEGTITDELLMKKLTAKADVVVHFAAESHVSYSIQNVSVFVETNVKGTQVICEAVKENGVERFINVSSSEVYGSALTVPMDENHPLLPYSPYAASKIGAERMVYAYYKTFNIPAVIIRPFNNYGSYQHIEKVIPRFITQALSGERLTVHDDGLQSRDWLYVEDSCAAIDKAVHGNIDNLKGESINIGTGKDTNILKIAEMILEYTGKPRDFISIGDTRPGQVNRHLSSTKKARDLLEWKASTEFFQGLARTIDWYQKNPLWWQKLRKIELSHTL